MSEDDDTATKKPSQAKATGLVSVAILFSRVLGLVREIVFSGIFGVSAFTDAFAVAFRTPNMLRDLFAEGALSTAFVATFSKKMKLEGDASAWQLARKMATLVACFMAVVVLLGVLLAPYIIQVLMPDWEAEQVAYTASLARVMYPFIFIVSLSALVMGMLNAKGRFFIPAMASSFFNIGSIIGGLLLAYAVDPVYFSDIANRSPEKALYGFAIGTLIGGFCQLAVQSPSLWRAGFRYRPDFGWRDSGVKKVLTLMWPAIIAGSAVQVNVLLNSMFASFLMDGSVTWLERAFRLMQLPLGVFGVAVGMVTLPAVSRAAAEGITPEVGGLLSKGLRLVFLLTLPSAVGLIVLAEPIISLIYERGKFTGVDSAMAGAALQTYGLGLVFYAGIKVLQPAFYAIDKRFVPMVVSFCAIGINVALNCLWIFVLDFGERMDGHKFLSFSTSVGAVVNFGVLYIAMRRFAGHLQTGRLLMTLLKLGVASALLGGVCWAGQGYLMAGWDGFGFLKRMATLLPTIGVAGGVFFVVTLVLKVEETKDFLALVKRRVGRR
ncbi:MAG: murein biosynthesis integral membrane protein MurJ [Verrucomicrobiales bacterium]|nr:murein biosynthesis integral membrane protein MurJ [Verrucomicrobiales bacterium]